MSDIFISYAREDRDKAKALAELCQQQDWSVWWDRRIPPGRSFDEVIEEALGAAKCVWCAGRKAPHHQTGSKAKRQRGCAGKFWFRCALIPRMLPRPLVANENCSTSTVFLYKPIKMLRIEKDLLRGAVDLMASSS
jgi:hypothetical protein